MTKQDLAAVDIYEIVLPLLWQYRDDMKRPPSDDSRDRRIIAINAALEKMDAQ